MQIGGTNNAAVNGINLTSAELAQIETTSTGTITLGDSLQSGNITFTSATPATTAGVNVVQSATSAGAIILNDSSGTALNGNGGKVTLTAGTGAIQTTLYSAETPLLTDGFTPGSASLDLSLGFAPTVGTQITIVGNTATPAGSNPINGTFSNLAQGATATLNYAGTPYYFQANYSGGDGNDLVLTNYAATPSQLAITGQPPATVTAGSGFSLTVSAEDSEGDVAVSFSGVVTVALANNPGGSTLGGTLTATASNGVAVFSGLTLNKAAGGYQLSATSSSLSSATSSAILVAPAPPRNS